MFVLSLGDYLYFFYLRFFAFYCAFALFLCFAEKAKKRNKIHSVVTFVVTFLQRVDNCLFQVVVYIYITREST